MKLVALTSAALLAATTAFAGNVAFEPVAETPIIEEVVDAGSGSFGSGGSGLAAWIIPIAAIAAIIIAVSTD